MYSKNFNQIYFFGFLKKNDLNLVEENKKNFLDSVGEDDKYIGTSDFLSAINCVIDNNPLQFDLIDDSCSKLASAYGYLMVVENYLFIDFFLIWLAENGIILPTDIKGFTGFLPSNESERILKIIFYLCVTKRSMSAIVSEFVECYIRSNKLKKNNMLKWKKLNVVKLTAEISNFFYSWVKCLQVSSQNDVYLIQVADSWQIGNKDFSKYFLQYFKTKHNFRELFVKHGGWLY